MHRLPPFKAVAWRIWDMKDMKTSISMPVLGHSKYMNKRAMLS